MKKFLLFSLLASTAVVTIFTACTKEAIAPNEEGITGNIAVGDRGGSSSFTITSEWAAGATTMLNGTAHAAQTNTVTVWNDFSNGTSGRIGFQRWDQSGNASFGRTNGAGDNGVATHAFAYKVNAWTAPVPFAFGTRPGNREAIWTPTFINPGIPTVSMGLFVTDNGQGDQDLTVGTIRVGNWRAVQLTIWDGTNFRKRVSVEELVNSNWVQRVRPNNNNGIVEMRAFTVVNVRSNYSIINGAVSSPTTITIPVLKSQLVGINNSIPNGPIKFWTLQKGGQVSYNDEMFQY
jgi:hypothetical protein